MATSGKVMQLYKLMFFTKFECFPRLPSRVLRDSTHAVEANCVLLGKEH